MSASAAEVLRGKGLCASGWLRSHSHTALFSTVESASRLAAALGELGGLYRAFGQFLRWRADLLDPEYRDALRDTDFSREPLAMDAAVAVLRRDLGARSAELETHLAREVLWSTIGRTAWRARWNEHDVVVQIARDSVPDAEFADFEKGIGQLRHTDLTKVRTPAILKQFREWIRAGESSVRERAYLDVLNRNPEATLAAYPRLIPELSSGRVLVWKWAAGESLADRIRKGDKEAVIAAAAAVLEQFCSLAVVEADLDLSAILLDASGRLTFRRIGHPVAVPPAMVNGGMKYIAAVLTGNDSLAAEQLAFLAAGAFRNETARDLVGAFSGVEPELKIRLWFPPTATAMETNWRALEQLKIPRLLFLDCMQRNLSALGYWNADAVARGATRFDAIAEAQWAVIGRLMRAQTGELANREMAAQWVMGAGILMFGAAREFNRLSEEIRENNLTLGLDIAPATHTPGQSARNWITGAAMAMVLAALLATIQWGPRLDGGWRAAAVAFAAGAAASLFWLVSRLG